LTVSMNRHGSMIVPPCLVVGAAETFGLTPDPEPLLLEPEIGFAPIR
jgi:hypothetical protein